MELIVVNDEKQVIDDITVTCVIKVNGQLYAVVEQDLSQIYLKVIKSDKDEFHLSSIDNDEEFEFVNRAYQNRTTKLA